MDHFVSDLRYAIASLRRTPGLTVTVLATLALGIGATTAVFTVVHGVLLAPLPWPESDRLVRLWEEHPGGVSPAGNRWLSLRTRVAWTEGARTIEGTGSYGERDYIIRRRGVEPMIVHGSTVSPSVFSLLRAAPALGRFLVTGEDAASAAPVAVLSDRLWRDQFGGDPAVIGRMVDIDGQMRTIVGVARPELAFPNPRVQFWIPAVIPADADEPSRTVVSTTLGRLRPGVTPQQAEAEGTTAARSRPRKAALRGVKSLTMATLPLALLVTASHLEQ